MWKYIKYILAGLGVVALLIALTDWIAVGVLVPHSRYILVAGLIMLIPGGPDLAIIGIERLQEKLGGISKK
jgi:hypothetical protein